jgi:hypothetical protein
MLGNTLTLPHSGGDLVLVKINQDAYSSEYLLKEALQEHRVRIRHSKTSVTTSRPSYDRHNVEYVETIYAVADGAAEHTRKFYIVIEQLPNDTDVENADAVADLMILTTNAFLDSLMGWES